MANTLKFKRGLLAGLPTAAEGEPLFTTDSNDLYIGTSTGNQRFQKYIASGATTQILRGDGSLYSFPLAISSPSNGQVLKYNGTNWVNDSDAGITGSGSAGQVAYFTGATTQAGTNNLFWDNTNGRLGIGINVPIRTLHVNGGNGLRVGGFGVRNSVQSANSGFIQVGSSDNLYGMLDFNAYDANTIFEVSNTNANNNAELRLGGGFITFRTASTPAERARFHTSGNFGINTGTSDTGQRLQVIGDAFIKGSGASSTTIGLTVQNTNNNDTFKVRNDGVSIFGQGAFNASPSIFPHDRLSPGSINVLGGGLSFNSPISGTTGTRFWFGSQFTSGNASGTNRQIFSEYNVNDITGGTATYTNLTLSGAISQTGGSNGITRGLHITPTLTAAADWRSIEWSNNSGWGLYGAGSANNYLAGSLGIGVTNPQYKLDVQGTSNTVAIRAASNTANDILYYATGTVTGQLNAFLTSINATGAVSGSLLNNNSATGSAFLDINVTAASTGDPYLSLTTSGATNWSIGIDNSDSDKLKIGPNSNPSIGTPSMTMFTGGNIAIGSTTDNTYKLQLNGGISLGNTGGIAILYPGGQAIRSNGTIFVDYGQGGTGDLQFRGGATLINTAIFYNNNNINFNPSGVGNVGISQASPVTRLDVQGAIATGGALAAHQTDRGIFEYNSNKVAIRAYGSTSGSGIIAFNTGGGGATTDSERVRVKAEGHVRFVPLAAAPTTNVQSGDVYYDSSTNKLRCYDGTSWNNLF